MQSERCQALADFFRAGVVQYPAMNDDQLTRLLQDLVRIPSVNPHGDPGTDPANTGEGRLAEYLAEFFRKLALDVEFHEVEPGRPTVIGKFASRGGKRSLALGPHTDTVSVAGMTIDPFGGEIRDGRLWGRGATDTKGPMASLLAALANAVRSKTFREGDLDVYFTALMGEESGNDGVRDLMQRGFRVDFAIAGEPTDCQVVTAHKGALWFKLHTRGQSVHGSMPERGVSAIGKMAPVVAHILGPYTEQLRQQPDAVLGAPTVNIGVIEGGSQTNIVPNHCLIELDRRTVPGEDHRQIMADLVATFPELGLESELVRDCPSLDTDPANPYVRELAAATGLGDRACAGAPWFCDAGIFSQFGVPAVAFGPGSVAQAHTADEFIDLAEVYRGARIAEQFLLNSAG